MSAKNKVEETQGLINEIIETWNKRVERNRREPGGWATGARARNAWEKKKESLEKSWLKRLESIEGGEGWKIGGESEWMEAAETAAQLGMTMAMAEMVKKMGDQAPAERAWEWMATAMREAGGAGRAGCESLAAWLKEKDPEAAKKKSEEALDWAIFLGWKGLIDTLDEHLDPSAPMWVDSDWLEQVGVSPSRNPDAKKRRGPKFGPKETLMAGGVVGRLMLGCPEKLIEWARSGKISKETLRGWQKKAIESDPGLMARLEAAELEGMVAKRAKPPKAERRPARGMRL